MGDIDAQMRWFYRDKSQKPGGQGVRKGKGLHVRCVDCGAEKTGLRTSCYRRLRTLACEACGGRLRMVSWPGWSAYSNIGP